MFLSWASGPSSPWYRPQPDPGPPRNATQYGDAVDVAPAMGLPVLLLSPTAADPAGRTHGHRAPTVAPTQPDAVVSTAGVTPGYKHNGKNLHERHWRHVSNGALQSDLLQAPETGVRTETTGAIRTDSPSPPDPTGKDNLDPAHYLHYKNPPPSHKNIYKNLIIS